MKMAELERINGILGLTIMGLLVLFLILYAVYRSRLKMHLFIPIFTTLLYIPYEGYYRNPQVLQGVPIRVDLFLFIPLMEAAYICALVGWVVRMRRHPEDYPITFLMALVMGALSCALLLFALKGN